MRVGGYNARGMIIQSLLDTDLYKFTMMQVVLHHFPGAQVEYTLQVPHRGRRPAAGPATAIERRAGQALQPALPRRRARLPARPALHEVGLRRFPRRCSSSTRNTCASAPGEKPGEIDITVRGPWLHTIMYEIPLLAIVSELYFRRTQPQPDLAEGRRRLQGQDRRGAHGRARARLQDLRLRHAPALLARLAGGGAADLQARDARRTSPAPPTSGSRCATT